MCTFFMYFILKQKGHFAAVASPSAWCNQNLILSHHKKCEELSLLLLSGEFLVLLFWDKSTMKGHFLSEYPHNFETKNTKHRASFCLPGVALSLKCTRLCQGVRFLLFFRFCLFLFNQTFCNFNLLCFAVKLIHEFCHNRFNNGSEAAGTGFTFLCFFRNGFKRLLVKAE